VKPTLAVDCFFVKSVWQSVALRAALTALLLAPLALAQQPATITVRADKPGAPVPRSLHGIFFEEVNHAGDGGLYAELIQNRSFDATLPVEGCTLHDGKCKAAPGPSYSNGRTNNWSVPWKFASPWPSWSLEKPEGAAVEMSIETEKPLHPNNTTYLRLNVPTLPQGAAVRLLNEGFWGISIRDAETYDFSFFARQGAPTGARVRVGVVSADGAVLAQKDVALDGDDWKRYSGFLTASGTDAKAKFFLQPLSAGSLDLDFVSLFPRKTFKNRPNGLRTDLAHLLADLKPAFLRFPGGCVVEGATMENRVQWKKSIGPTHERASYWSVWGYRVTNGLGHHEFLQLCEDLGADAMWVVNVGLSCEYRNGDYWPDERVPELIQDTLDGIEYALGSADLKWGRMRAEAGHPEPFPLKYIEIGAENYGPLYQARYRQFAAVIKKAYPQLTLINCEKADGTEVLDEHYYSTPHFFFEGHRLYDNEPRTNVPRRYLGEFAVFQRVGTGNLTAALAETAFMMGLERNGDLVTMCSYAPLFFNANDIRWPVNMIGFDSARSFARTSYYGQRMLASNLPDVNVACETTSPTLELPHPDGEIGLGTWKSHAEFKDVKLTATDGKVLLTSNASKELTGFKPGSGTWRIADGALRQDGDGDLRYLSQANVPTALQSDFTLSLKARKLTGEGFFISLDHGTQGRNHWIFGGWEPPTQLEVRGIKMRRVPGTIEIGKWYDIRIELAGKRLRCFLDGKLVHDVRASDPLPSLYAVAGTKHETGELILKVVNAADKPQQTRINIKGTSTLSTSATLLSMSHPDRTAENSLTAPTKIAPRASAIEVSSDFTHTFSANSINVLRVKMKRQ
jgi:alpha-N-arabinofuranosidase